MLVAFSPFWCYIHFYLTLSHIVVFQIRSVCGFIVWLTTFPLLRGTLFSTFSFPTNSLSFVTAFSEHGKFLCIFDTQMPPPLIATTRTKCSLFPAQSSALIGLHVAHCFLVCLPLCVIFLKRDLSIAHFFPNYKLGTEEQ